MSRPDDSPAVPRWLDELRPGGSGEGFVDKGVRHSLMLLRRPSTRMLVTFDNLSNVGDTDVMREPWGFRFAQENGLTHLGVMAHVGDWYRDADLIARLTRLRDGGIFAEFDRVVFAGVSMGGYAALAFGSLVPGAHVIAINPQTTLDPDLVPWETRYESGRRQDWTLPLSDAAALTADLGRVNLFHDPYHALDQKHVDRLRGDNLRVFNCRHSSHKTAVFLRKIGALKPLMQHCIFDELTQPAFHRLYRARRDLPWFRGAVTDYFERTGRAEVAARFTRAFRARLAARDAPAAATPAPGVIRETAQTPGPARILATGRAGDARGAQGSGNRLIVTTMKNEGPFMLEWVAFNRAIGFTDFLIYTNDCADGTDAIAARLDAMGMAQHRENVFRTGGRPQGAALKAARKEAVYRQAHWLICADCDEFLNIRVGDGHLDDLFAATGEVDAISVCWKLFGNGGHLRYADGLVTERFAHCCGEHEFPNYRARGMKTLVRNTDRFAKLRIHRPAFHLDRGDVAWVDGGGRPMPDLYLAQGWNAHAGFTHDLARMHHYAVRSVESFLVKRDRGRTNHVGDDQGLAYWESMNFNTARDTSLHARLPALRREMARLLQDPELARLHAAACDWHRARIASLLAQDGWPAFRDEIARLGGLPDAVARPA
ncbi:glycosyltransferase family 2 protein [Roseovarius sp. D22-M7]|uniref:glycosyltransferase family 2 protein n=1 Tax=Roseovarius sp. D22-M7 TaxID=3127116 RepID=UPI0030102B1E